MKPALHLLSPLLVACVTFAQEDRQVLADMEFARGLASRFAYVDMAEEVIADLESKNLSGKQAEGLDSSSDSR